MRRPVVATAWLLALSLAWLLAGPVPASGRVHRVAAGESASSIAKRYYGDYDLAGLLVEYNGGGDATVIRIGQKLQIPVCPVHRVRSGDTWSVLAERYVGRRDAWPAVAMLNGLLPEKPLSIGMSLVFPVTMPHALRRGESLAGLAERYYGDPKRADVLQQFNAIADPRRLSVGQSIDVPLIAFRAAADETAPEPVAKKVEPDPKKVEPVAKKAEPDPKKTEPKAEPPKGLPFVEPLDRAAASLDRGEFDEARRQLDRLLGRVQAEGTEEARARLWEMTATVDVAFEDYDRACDAFRRLAALTVVPDLDPDRVSPKVRDAYAACVP